MKVAQEDLDNARRVLADIKPGDTIYTVLRHVSASGMTRWIDLYHMVDNEPRYISWAAATLIGNPIRSRNHEGIEVGGCGMDMGFALVYDLSRTLFPDGFECIGDRCPSNDHVNYRPSRGEVVPTHHREGGYALQQRWL